MKSTFWSRDFWRAGAMSPNPKLKQGSGGPNACKTLELLKRFLEKFAKTCQFMDLVSFRFGKTKNPNYNCTVAQLIKFGKARFSSRHQHVRCYDYALCVMCMCVHISYMFLTCYKTILPFSSEYLQGICARL